MNYSSSFYSTLLGFSACKISVFFCKCANFFFLSHFSTFPQQPNFFGVELINRVKTSAIRVNLCSMTSYVLLMLALFYESVHPLVDYEHLATEYGLIHI